MPELLAHKSFIKEMVQEAWKHFSRCKLCPDQEDILNYVTAEIANKWGVLELSILRQYKLMARIRNEIGMDVEVE